MSDELTPSEEPAPSQELLDRAFDRMNENLDDDGESFTAAALIIYDNAYLAGREAGIKVERRRIVEAMRVRETRVGMTTEWPLMIERGEL